MLFSITPVMFLNIFTCSFKFWFTFNFANREGFALYVNDFLFSHDVKASFPLSLWEDMTLYLSYSVNGYFRLRFLWSMLVLAILSILLEI